MSRRQPVNAGAFTVLLAPEQRLRTVAEAQAILSNRIALATVFSFHIGTRYKFTNFNRICIF